MRAEFIDAAAYFTLLALCDVARVVLYRTRNLVHEPAPITNALAYFWLYAAMLFWTVMLVRLIFGWGR